MLWNKAKRLALGEAGGVSEGMANCLPGIEVENKEEEILSQAIALAEENENNKEELLRQANALSLQDWKFSIIMSLIFVVSRWYVICLIKIRLFDFVHF